MQRLLPLLALALSGCTALGFGFDLGAAAQRTEEFSGYVADYNEINAAQLDEPLGDFNTLVGVQGGGRMFVGLEKLILGVGMDVGRMRMRTQATANDASVRDMKMTVTDIATEVELGLRHGPRLIGGSLIRSGRLVAVRSDAQGNSTDGETAGCGSSGITTSRCTLGIFEANSYPYYAGVAWTLPLRGNWGPRLTLTRVLDQQSIEPSQKTGTVTYADTDLQTTYQPGQYQLYDAFFPTRIKPGERARNASATLTGWRLALTLHFGGFADID